MSNGSPPRSETKSLPWGINDFQTILKDEFSPFLVSREREIPKDAEGKKVNGKNASITELAINVRNQRAETGPAGTTVFPRILTTVG